KDRGAFDKGHIVRRDDISYGRSYAELRRANGDTYHITNCSPQIAQFNQSQRGKDNWGDLENLVLGEAASERYCLFAG
ncbi:DNA/RNA non-specific endonuclease, partial [Escherichia coli]